MSHSFPTTSSVSRSNVIVGLNFDLMKKHPLHKLFIGYNQNVFKFNNNDRMIPSRHALTADFLSKTQVELFDVSAAGNNVKTMKKVKYQNHVRKLFLENQQTKLKLQAHKKKAKDCEKIKLIHADWACKVSDIRLKFLPDFETLKKPGFGHIRNFIWSNKQIIGASSARNVCLYHPFNGFTRAVDVADLVCITFSNSGDFLAMAYRKSCRGPVDQDLFVFHIDHKTLFHRENLETEKIRSATSQDITALCYTRNDDFLMCGTNCGQIIVLECISQKSQALHKWIFVKLLSSSYQKNDITKISFSAKFRYMASLDCCGRLVIWNGGSWTQLFYLQKENSSLYKHLEWHPFVEEELIFGKTSYPALYLINVMQKKVVSCYLNWKEDMEITSIAFNPVTAQLAVCFYVRDEYLNRVSILASMSQVLNSFDFDYIDGGLKLLWNSAGSMLGAGARSFRFAFWSFQKDRDFPMQVIKGSKSKNPELITAFNDSKLSSLR